MPIDSLSEEFPLSPHRDSIRTEVRDPRAVAAACRRLGLPEPVHGTARLFSGEAKGLLVKLPDWLYPAVIDTDDGAGPLRQLQRRPGATRNRLDRFLQIYAVERAGIEARKTRPRQIVEQALADGSIKLTITVGGGS